MLTDELAEMDASSKQATEIRQAEHKEFVKVSSDLSSSQKACATAIKVLKDYYGGGGEAFIQTSQPAGSAASSIIGMLETAEADFSRNLAEATTEEDQKQQ